LRHEYNMDIQRMMIASFHPKLHSFFSVEVKVRHRVLSFSQMILSLSAGHDPRSRVDFEGWPMIINRMISSHSFLPSLTSSILILWLNKTWINNFSRVWAIPSLLFLQQCCTSLQHSLPLSRPMIHSRTCSPLPATALPHHSL
jgi:hypothetical protein